MTTEEVAKIMSGAATRATQGLREVSDAIAELREAELMLKGLAAAQILVENRTIAAENRKPPEDENPRLAYPIPELARKLGVNRAVEPRDSRCGFFLKSLAISVSASYNMKMMTAKEIANRLASPTNAVRKVVDVRDIKPGEGGASGHSLPIGQPANQADIDAMWSGIVHEGNASVAAERLMFDRVRHWTREGLLSPVGDKNPGTGRARLYDESAVRKARVLNSLTECGVTVRNLHVINNFLDSKAAEWLTKTAGSYDLVYLVIQKFRWIDERDMQIRHLTRGDNIPELMFGKTVECAIVVDLTG